ncbi:Chalcone-flavanone isomerase family protein [Hirschfeldia incana]|nr:Chalcone-flavanone isomerase family protein [Hirschfeldia incana]
METPLSTTRVAGSQAIFSTNNSDSLCKTEDSSLSQRKNTTKAQEVRSALIDITNDSPIVGLAMQTPPSGFVCKRQNSRIIKSTPGSGEALLRGQVKTLLEKVEEGTELAHSVKPLPFIHLVTSPMRLLAPTPANTPQFPSFSDHQVQIKIASPVVAGHSRTSQVSYVNGSLKGSEIFEEEVEMSMSISRSLLFDFTDKSEALWEEGEENEEVVEKKTQAGFAGKHSRLVNNSEDDDEIIEAKKVCY